MQFRRLGRSAVVAATLVLGAGAASALTVPFTEDFTSTVSGWENAVNNPLTLPCERRAGRRELRLGNVQLLRLRAPVPEPVR